MEETVISTQSPQESLLPWYRRLNQMKGLLLVLVSMAQMLDIINVASVTIALPNIKEDVGYSTGELRWVTSAYALSYGAFLLIGGRFGWRWIFYFTAIIGFVMSFLGFVVIPASKGESKVTDHRIDFLGISAFTIGIVCVIFYHSESPVSGWAVVKTLAPFLIGLGLLFAFVFIEYKIDYPIMPLYIWKSRRLVASSLAIICVSAAQNAMVYFFVTRLPERPRYTPLQASLCYIVSGVGSVAMNVVVNKLLKRVRSKLLMLVGWVLFVASGMLFAQTDEKSTYWSIPFPAMIINFIGMVPVWLCCQINSVADADDKDQGVVGAAYNVTQQIGAPIGIAVANIVANNFNSPTAKGAEFLPGYRAALYSYATMAGIGLVATILFAANNDPAEMHQSPLEDGAADAGDEEAGREKKEGSGEKITSEVMISLGSVGRPGEKIELEENVVQPGEKYELKD